MRREYVKSSWADRRYASLFIIASAFIGLRMENRLTSCCETWRILVAKPGGVQCTGAVFSGM
jgi:hypothetical protein